MTKDLKFKKPKKSPSKKSPKKSPKKSTNKRNVIGMITVPLSPGKKYFQVLAQKNHGLVQ